jgi:sugar O-acyltransferase (sialic acid O-acetyltransferase NeuD family)
MEDTTTPNVFLGFSGNILALIFETLAANKAAGPVRIIENIPARDEVAFAHPAVRYERVALADWTFARGGDRLGFALAKPGGKRTVLELFAAAQPLGEDDFGTLVSPHSFIASSARVGRGSYFEPGVVVSAFAEIGFGVTLNRGCTIGHHTRLGRFVSVNPGAHVAGQCDLGEAVQLGIGAVVFDNIKIGANSIIGGGSVVTRDIPPGVLAFGNPCKVIREIGE